MVKSRKNHFLECLKLNCQRVNTKIMNIQTKITSRFSALLNRSRFQIARAVLPNINDISNAQLSMIYPASQYDSGQIKELIDISLAAAADAGSIDLSDVSERIQFGTKWPDIWPGEHYKLLAALIRLTKAAAVVEIGTFLGLSALAMKKYQPPGGKVVTFDIVPWRSLPGTCLKDRDFIDDGLEQVLADLANPDVFANYAGILSHADMIFLDGPKNRTFERAFLQQLMKLRFAKPALLVIDDIRLWNMLDIWHEIPFPKLDVTSLGHFSGTGLVRL